MEFFSTTFTGFNKTSKNGLSFLSGNLVTEQALEYGMDCVIADHTKYTSDVVFVLKHPLKN